MPKDIMTVPREIANAPVYFLTGNEYISLPEIDPHTAGLKSLNLLHMGAVGLLEFQGSPKSPLISPFLIRQGRREDFQGKLAWSYRQHWIPSFTYLSPGLTLKGEIFCPPGHRGGVYSLTVKNTETAPQNLELGFDVHWQRFNHIIFNRRLVEGQHHASPNEWTQSLILEARAGLPLASLALGLGDEASWHLPAAASKNAAFTTAKGATSPTALAAAQSSIKVRLAAGATTTIPLYMAVNIEGDGAGTTIVDLRRHGHAALQEETLTWLKEHALKTEKFEALTNRNLFFTYFFAAGRTLDTDEWVPVTSRSPRYYVSAAFWSRDTLLWSFPGLLLVDPETARAILLRIFAAHMERAGEHAHYINGTLLYPGFELDQLSAHAIALHRYISQTGDDTILKEMAVKKGLETLTAKLHARFDYATGLFGSFLDPSDDPVRYPYLIYSNALAQRALAYLAGFWEEEAFATDIDLTASAAALKENIYRLGVVDGPFGPMFAWAVDGKGGVQVYDNPPGSLQLLAHYGFCEREDPVFWHTCHWIHSSHNPYYHQKGPILGAASRHAPNPWPLWAANDLLALNLGGEEFFRRAQMDNGFCCETVHPRPQGKASTGLAFASAAGFLAYALWQAYGREG